MMRKFRGDLHLHTCLSPCGDLGMTPTAIVRHAREANLDMIGICDHNSAENVVAVRKAGKKENLAVLGGIEITTREEVHILALFDDDDALMDVQSIVYENLSGENDEEFFGPQVVVDECDRVIGSNKKLLIGATGLSIEDIVQTVHNLGGLAIASHIERERFGIIGQLGFVPEGLELDGVEITSPAAKQRIGDFPVVSFSDAHYPKDIGRSFTTFLMEDANVCEVGKALLNKNGRKVSV